MKVLLVMSSGGDYSAVHFQNNYAGVPVKDIIANPSAYLPTEEQEEDYQSWDLDVIDLGNVGVPDVFLQFVRDEVQDYEDRKHRTFFMEDEIITEP